MYHSFLTHSFTDGHLGCFQHLGIVNSTAMNIEVHRFFSIVSGFLGYNPSSVITGPKSCSVFTFFKDFVYLFLERGEGREKEREKNINVWLPLTHPLLGTWPATQACALTVNRTGDP